MKLKIFIFFILFANISFAQDKQYAREIIKEICSPKYEGRGYDHNGDLESAIFLAKEFDKHGLKSSRSGFFQMFPISVNTFPDKVQLIVDDIELVPGADYILNAASGSVSGTYDLVHLNNSVVKDTLQLKTFFNQNFEDRFLTLDTIGMPFEVKEILMQVVQRNYLNAKGIIEITSKNLTYIPARFEMPYVHIIAKASIFNSSAKSIKVKIKNDFQENRITQNIIAYIPGKTDSFIVFSAHYDHLGKMGDGAYFPGAHDNASGVATVLDLARHYSENDEQQHYSYAFILFSGEEIGLLGSHYYTQNPIFPLTKIKVLLNLDIIGSGEDGITIVNGSIFKDEFATFQKINNSKFYLTKINSRGAARNSDHYYFYENGVKSFFIYTHGAYKEYHNIYDRAENVPLNAYDNLFKLLTDFVETVK